MALDVGSLDVKIRSCDLNIRANVFKQRYYQDEVILYCCANIGENHVAGG